VHAATRGWRTGARLAAGALGLPIVALIPAQLVDSSALVENVLRFPLGHGLVSSPAQSPFPGHLIAAALPGGRLIAAALLGAAGLAIAAWLVRRPPRTAAATALICGYGLLAAILLMPSTRFGYLLYPIAFLAWAPAMRPWAGRRGARRSAISPGRSVPGPVRGATPAEPSTPSAAPSTEAAGPSTTPAGPSAEAGGRSDPAGVRPSA
jgi:hypothetical protein